MYEFNFKKPKEGMRREMECPLIIQARRTIQALPDSCRCVVGGGFLRDIFFGRLPKDLDVFMNANDMDDCALLDYLAKRGFTARVLVSNEAIEYLSFTDVSSVIEATHPYFDYPIQIIRMARHNESPERMIERLDLGPCQIGMDVEGNIWHTEQFTTDAFNQTFTITRDEGNDRTRSVKRFHRLSAKYPGWKLVG